MARPRLLARSAYALLPPRSISRPLRPAPFSRPLSTSHRVHTPLLSSSTTPPSSSSAASSSSTSSSGFTTINASEIDFFSKLSSEWWNTSGEFGLLHRMNPARVDYLRQKIALDRRDEGEWTFAGRKADLEREEARGRGKWLEGKRVLDVGCGGGLLSESLARLGAEVVGVDASPSNIAIANLHASQDPFLPYIPPRAPASPPTEPTSSSFSSLFSPQIAAAPSPAPSSQRGSLEYRHTSAETLRDAGEKFDVVCAMEVLEHVDEPGEFMRCLGEIVKPGGYLVLSTISRTPLSRLLTITLAEDVLRLVSPGTHTYSKFVKPVEIRRFLHSDMGGFDTWEREENAGDVREGEVGETRGIVYDPLGGVWRLWNGVEGGWWKGMGEGANYMFSARKRKDAV